MTNERERESESIQYATKECYSHCNNRQMYRRRRNDYQQELHSLVNNGGYKNYNYKKHTQLVYKRAMLSFIHLWGCVQLLKCKVTANDKLSNSQKQQ